MRGEAEYVGEHVGVYEVTEARAARGCGGADHGTIITQRLTGVNYFSRSRLTSHPAYD